MIFFLLGVGFLCLAGLAGLQVSRLDDSLEFYKSESQPAESSEYQAAESIDRLLAKSFLGERDLLSEELGDAISIGIAELVAQQAELAVIAAEQLDTFSERFSKNLKNYRDSSKLMQDMIVVGEWDRAARFYREVLHPNRVVVSKQLIEIKALTQTAREPASVEDWRPKYNQTKLYLFLSGLLALVIIFLCGLVLKSLARRERVLKACWRDQVNLLRSVSHLDTKVNALHELLLEDGAEGREAS